MKKDIFGNDILDTRSDTRKKLDEIWDVYCEMFDTCLSFDDFLIDEEKILEYMSKSIKENKDYLCEFILKDDLLDDNEY